MPLEIRQLLPPFVMYLHTHIRTYVQSDSYSEVPPVAHAKNRSEIFMYDLQGVPENLINAQIFYIGNS